MLKKVFGFRSFLIGIFLGLFLLIFSNIFQDAAKSQDFLPYAVVEDEEIGDVYSIIRSEKGLQKIVVKKDSLTSKLYESEKLKPELEDWQFKANSTPVFQYKNVASAEWHDYKLKEITGIKTEKRQDFSLITQGFIFEDGTRGQNILKIGYDDNQYFSKWTFKLGDNPNTNRMIWRIKPANEIELSEQEISKININKKLSQNNLNISWSDFKEESRYEFNNNIHNIYFYEQGKLGALEVDPTVSVTVVSATITVQNDDFKIVFDADGLYGTDGLYIPASSGTNRASTAGSIGESWGGWSIRDITPNAYNSGTSQGTQGTDWDVELLEASDTRVVIRRWEHLNAWDNDLNGIWEETYWIIYGKYMTVSHLFTRKTGTNVYNYPTFYHGYEDWSTPGWTAQYKVGGGSWTDDPGTRPDIGIENNYFVYRNDKTAPAYYIGGGSYATFPSGWHNIYTNFGDYSGRSWACRDIASGANTSEDTQWLFKYYFSNSDITTEAEGMGQDYRNPDDLTFTTGSGWYDTDENTVSATDEFNEAEGIYALEASSNEVEFDIDGGTYTRYKPGFKIRDWRTTSEPGTVTLESVSKSSGTDYNADLKVFSEAWYDDNGTEDQIADGGDTSSADEYIGEASNNYTLTGFTTTDYLYLGSDDQFTGVNYLLATAGVGGAITWEYWDGDSWEDLTGVTGDDDLDSTDSNFYFTEPGTWSAYTLTSGSEGITGERELYWIRANVTDAFETVPVVDRMWTDILLFQYLSDISSDNQTFYISDVSNSAPNAPQTPYVNDSTAQSGQATPVTGLTDHTPAFSAIFDDDDTSDTAEYYEIDVGDDTDWGDTPELWDGSKTAQTSCNENSRCADAVYAGSTLSDGTTYYWRIRFWDDSDEAGAWSSTQQFTMNTNPTVSSVSLNSGSNINLSEGTTTEISWTATVTDDEGYEDIASATGVAYRSGVSGAEACTPNDNNCYQDADCALSGCSGNSCTATCTINMQFHTDPTDSGTYSAQYWLGWVEATDDYSESGNDTSPNDTTEVNSLIGLSVDASIAYGSLFAGDDTGSSNETITVTNTGNTAIDNEFSGDNLCTDYPTCSGYSIAVGYQEYNLSGFTYDAGTDLTGSPVTVQINLSKPTTSPSDSDDVVYWGMGIPDQKETGTYSGANVITAISDS